MKTLFAGLVVAALALVAPAQAQDVKGKLVASGTLTVATSGSAPPFSITDATGKLDGFDVDFMNKVAQELSLPVKYVQIDFAGLLPGLTAGRFDVVASGVTRTPQRIEAKEFRLLSPYIVNGVAITRRSADTNITSWKDVCGKRMGGVRGGVFQKTATEKLPAGCVSELREYPGFTEMLLDLRNNRIDFMAHDFLGPNYQIAQGATGITVLPDVLDTITQSVAVNAANPALADAIEAMIKKWRGDGTLDAMIKKRFGAALDWKLVQ